MFTCAAERSPPCGYKSAPFQPVRQQLLLLIEYSSLELVFLDLVTAVTVGGGSGCQMDPVGGYNSKEWVFRRQYRRTTRRKFETICVVPQYTFEK